MAATPTPAAEVVRGYVQDKATGEWFQIGGAVGPHTHADYVPLVGGVDVQPGNLGVVAPASLNHAARWADGVPRFADAAARDAAYLTIGGPAAGMRCWVTAPYGQEFTYISGAWRITGGLLPSAYVLWRGWSVPAAWSRVSHAPVDAHTSNGLGTVDATGLITITEPGRYSFTASAFFTVVGTDRGITVGDAGAQGSSFLSDLGAVPANTHQSASYSAVTNATVGRNVGVWVYNQGGGTGDICELVLQYIGPII